MTALPHVAKVTTAPTHFALAVVMERVAIRSRWQSHQWRPAYVVHDDGSHRDGETIAASDALTQRVFVGLDAALHADEAEGYYLNISAPDPKLFVAWRLRETDAGVDAGDAYPHRLTLSYNEAARWMDAQESVDAVPLPAEIAEVLAAWVEANYAPPQKKQRIRPRSFESKEGRYKGGLS
jgi:hypothetical protein